MRTEIKIAIAVGLLVILGAIVWTVRDAAREKQITELPSSLVSGGGKAAEPARSTSPGARPEPAARVAPVADAAKPSAGSATPAEARAPQPPREQSGSRPLTVQPPPARESTPTPPAVMPPAQAAEARDGAPASVLPLPPLAPPVTVERKDEGSSVPPRSPTADGKPAGSVEPPVVSTPPPTGRPGARGDSGEAPGNATPPPGPGNRSPGTALSEAGIRPAQSPPAAGGGGETIYTVQEADTLSAIAREVYGDDRLWTKIRDANPGIDPDRLLVGQRLRLPPKEAVRAGRSNAPAADAGRAADARRRAEPGKPPAGREPGEAAGAAPRAGAQEAGGTYVVESGDTLIRIAKKVFNDPGRWREIYELNRDRLRSPDEVPVGMTLKLPQPGRERPRERG